MSSHQHTKTSTDMKLNSQTSLVIALLFDQIYTNKVPSQNNKTDMFKDKTRSITSGFTWPQQQQYQ